MIYLDLIFNLSLLVTLSLVSGFVEKRWPRDTRSGVLLQGLLFGVVAVIGMLNPVVLGPGLIFDGRSVIISLCALFFGPLAVSATFIITIVCRVALGGPGTIMGVSVILASSIIGLWAHYHFKPSVKPPSILRLFALGLAVHLVMVVLMFTLPGNLGLATFSRLGLPVILLYPIATILIGKILSDQGEAWRNMKALRKSEEKYREVVESANSIILRMDSTGVITFFNDYASRFLGFSKEEIIGRNVVGTIVPSIDSSGKDLAQMVLDLSVHPEQYKNNENENICKDGTRVWVVWTNRAILDDKGQCVEILCIGNDITERKLMENALRESEEKFRVLAESTPTAVMLYQDDRWIYANKATETICGYSEDELLAMNFWDLVHPEFRPGIQKEGRKRQRGEETTNRHEFKIITKDGHEKWVNLSGASTLFRGKPAGILSVLDVTEQRQGEELLKNTMWFQQVLMDAVPTPIFYKDAEGVYIGGNKAFEQYLGMSPEQFIGKTVYDIAPADLAAKYDEADRELLNNPGIQTYETSFVYADGIRHHVIFNKATYTNAEGKVAGLIGVILDITDRKRAENEKQILEERLNRAEKMEALGQLAGGVAHDLNNVLGVLSGYSELLLMEIPEGQRARSHAEKILQSTEKGAAIIQDLLTLARRGVTVTDVINLNSVISGFLKNPVFENIKDHHPRVTFKIEHDNNLLNIKGSPVHLEKTLMNLVTNAAESISGTGEVTIRTESRYLDRAVRGYDAIKEGDYAVLIVSDTGTGIPVEYREKIFEPFYTKKTMGRSGTGLGLAIVWGTVKDLNGYIDVQTEISKGTTFSLYFPVSREEMIAPKQKVSIKQYMGKGESVLVVDDIAAQRDVASGLLKRLAYEVHAVTSGEEAVEYLKDHKVDILVLDMIMAPGIDGLETYQSVLKINPKQKCILVSGFSETDRVKEAQKLGAGAYVKKPYVLEKIGVAIRDELNR